VKSERPWYRDRRFWIVTVLTWCVSSLLPIIPMSKGALPMGSAPLFFLYAAIVQMPGAALPWVGAIAHTAFSFAIGGVAMRLREPRLRRRVGWVSNSPLHPPSGAADRPRKR